MNDGIIRCISLFLMTHDTDPVRPCVCEVNHQRIGNGHRFISLCLRSDYQHHSQKNGADNQKRAASFDTRFGFYHVGDRLIKKKILCIAMGYSLSGDIKGMRSARSAPQLRKLVDLHAG